jgi:hypothetical protein
MSTPSYEMSFSMEVGENSVVPFAIRVFDKEYVWLSLVHGSPLNSTIYFTVFYGFAGSMKDECQLLGFEPRFLRSLIILFNIPDY